MMRDGQPTQPIIYKIKGQRQRLYHQSAYLDWDCYYSSKLQEHRLTVTIAHDLQQQTL